MHRTLPPLSRRRPDRVAALVFLLGCTHSVPSAPRVVGSPPLDPAVAFRGATHEPFPAAWRSARPGPPPPPSDGFLDPLGAAVEGGTFDEGEGVAMSEALSLEDPAQVDAWGAGLFPLDRLLGTGDFAGDGPLCTDPHAFFSFSDGDVDWEARIHMYAFLQLVAPVQAMFMELSDTCADGVTAEGGDVGAAVAAGTCSEEEEEAFFTRNEACLACVEGGVSTSDCLSSGECLPEAPAVAQYARRWYRWAESTVLACAPDVRMKVYLASNAITDEGVVPEAWNQTDWPYLCFGIRDPDTGEIERTCVPDGDGYSDITDGYADGLIGRFDYLREVGDTATPHADRVIYSQRLSFLDGTTTSQMLLSFGGTGQISAPLYTEDHDGDGDIDDDDWGFGHGGYGFGPRELRPDGTDPTNLDDTYAREWLAAVATKMSTTRDGVPINNINHSRCLEWAGPHDDGSWTCTQNGGPALGWFEDNHVLTYSASMVLVESLATLGSTGLPDDLMPGGFTPHMAGTAALANPNWDNCTWPHQYVPDHIRTEDVPLDWGGVASLDADTYKFGKDPDQDLRLILATPQMRGFCPEE